MQEVLGVLVAEDGEACGERPAHFLVQRVHHHGAHVLVADAFHQAVLQRVAERTMADVVQHDGDVRAEPFLFADGVALGAQHADGLAHEVHGAQRMVEACVQGPGVYQVAQPQLLDVPQPLEPPMVDEGQQGGVRHGDEAVDGVVEYLFSCSHGGSVKPGAANRQPR